MDDKVKRWAYVVGNYDSTMEEDEHGNYVTHADHAAEVDAYEATIAKLQEQLRESEERGTSDRQIRMEYAQRLSQVNTALLDSQATLKSTQESLLATKAEADGLRVEVMEAHIDHRDDGQGYRGRGQPECAACLQGESCDGCDVGEGEG